MDKVPRKYKSTYVISPKDKEKEEFDNLRYRKDLTREELDRRDELEYKLNKPEEDTQTTLIKYNRVSRIKERVRSLVPSCDKCRQKQYCDVLEAEEKIKCLKRRVYQFTKLKYRLFDIDIEDNLLDIAIEIFWNNIKREEENIEKKKENTNLNSGDKGLSSNIKTRSIDSYVQKTL